MAVVAEQVYRVFNRDDKPTGEIRGHIWIMTEGVTRYFYYSSDTPGSRSLAIANVGEIAGDEERTYSLAGPPEATNRLSSIS